MPLRPLLLACLLTAGTYAPISLAQLQADAAPAPVSEESFAAELQQLNDPAVLLQMAGELREAKEHSKESLVWQRLVTLRPHVGAYRYEQAATFAVQDRKSEAYNALLEMQAAGYANPIEDDPRFQPVHGTEVWQYIVQGFVRNRDAFGEGSVIATLPKEDLLIESLAFDPTRGRLLVGSVREGKVFVVEEGGKIESLVAADDANSMWGVFGVAVDAKRGILWVASTAVPHFRGYNAERDLGKAGIFKFELASGKFIKSFLSPVVPGQGFFLSDITVASDGSVYALDAVNNAIYQVRDDSFRRLLHAPHLSGLRALAVSDDAGSLYFSDAERGLFGLDLGTAKPFDLRVPPKLSLSSIEGLAFWNGYLIAVQNGLPPNRIMRLKLSDDGRAVVQAHPLDANQPALSLQVGAALGPNAELYLIGNSQRENYDRFGLPRNRDRIEGARIYKLQADFALQREEPPQTQFVR
jgi:hypothetical protein